MDTGSADATREIAAAAGARVVDFPWRHDFAAARNHGLLHATGAWILYIDADERARDWDRAALDALLDDRSLVACTVRFRPRSGYTRYREYRLFRNDPRIRFHGVIHETMLPAIQRVVAEDGRRIGESDLAIDHVGYDGERTAKHRRNLPLLRARLAAEPDHVYCWQQLGHTLLALGTRRGRSARGVEAWTWPAGAPSRWPPIGACTSTFSSTPLAPARGAPRSSRRRSVISPTTRCWPGSMGTP